MSTCGKRLVECTLYSTQYTRLLKLTFFLLLLFLLLFWFVRCIWDVKDIRVCSYIIIRINISNLNYIFDSKTQLKIKKT